MNYNSPLHSIRLIKLRWMTVAGHDLHIGEVRNAHSISVEEPTRDSPLERPRRRLEDDIKRDLQQIGRECRVDSACLL
jgi:hypothetical protein